MSAPAQTIKERPILMTGPMVTATLADLKSQTRRVVKPQPTTPVRYDGPAHDGGDGPDDDDGPSNTHYWERIDTDKAKEKQYTEDYRAFDCPYGRVGDRLWVRESHWQFGQWFPAEASGGAKKRKKRWAIYAKLPACIRYGEKKPTSTRESSPDCFWRRVPGIHMPRWASGLTLEITGIRVEKLKEITEIDAIAEGSPPGAIECSPTILHPQRIETPIKYVWGFERVWDRINGAKPGFTWKDNPWVWVLKFRRIPQEGV